MRHPRKKKAMHKSVSGDDKRLQSVLKKMGMNAIPGIQEVNIFHSDTVTQFINPKGRVSWCRPDISKLQLHSASGCSCQRLCRQWCLGYKT